MLIYQLHLHQQWLSANPSQHRYWFLWGERFQENTRMWPRTTEAMAAISSLLRGIWCGKDEYLHFERAQIPALECFALFLFWRLQHRELQNNQYRVTTSSIRVYLFQNFDSHLCLRCCRKILLRILSTSFHIPTSGCIVSPLINESLQMLPVLHLRFVFFSQVAVAFGLCWIELSEVPVIWLTLGPHISDVITERTPYNSLV